MVFSGRYKWCRRKHCQGIVLADNETASVHHWQVSSFHATLIILCAMLTEMFRSQDKADSLCKELEDLNPGSQAIFIQKDISILKNVDEVCEELQRREKKINILFLSAGYMSLSGRKGKSLYSAENFTLLTTVKQKLQKDLTTKWPSTTTPGCASS